MGILDLMACPYYPIPNSCSLDGVPVSSEYAEKYCSNVCFDSCHKYHLKLQREKDFPDPNPMATFEGAGDPIVELHYRAQARRMEANPHVNKDRLSAQIEHELESSSDLDWLLLG